MKNFEVYSVETAPAKSRPALNRIRGAMGFVPNMLGIFAEAPAVLEGSFALFGQLGQGQLSPIEQ